MIGSRVKKPYQSIIATWEERLREHGDSPQSVGWTAPEASIRYRVMLDVIRRPGEPASLLDFGCGASHLYEYILKHEIRGIRYHGLDISQRFLELSRAKFPDLDYLSLDVLDPDGPEWPQFDYIVMNGVLTYKGDVATGEMFEYCRALLPVVFAHADIGMAFNVMTKQVDWEREDLFHLEVDPLLSFLAANLSRHVVVRHDYGLYEYTIYVYRDPLEPSLVKGRRTISPPTVPSSSG